MKGKRILSVVLSAALLLQLSPLAAFAEDTAPLPDTTPAALTEDTEPELLAAPTPEVEEEPTPEPSAEPTAEPVVEDTALLTAEPTETPTPDPTAEPTAAPAEETPAPESTAEPTPEPTAEPTASPDPAEQVQALIDALPDADAVTGDTADEVEAQLTAIDDAKASLTDEQLAGLDFARYDAAANALLALWGEAPTDEVETLATYPEPGKDGDWYVIASTDDLYWLATTAPKNVKAKLTADITVNSKVLDENGNLAGSGLKEWTPIGTNADQFTGTLDGQGHTISGLYCATNDSYVGLFGCIAQSGTVTHLGVVDSYFSGSSYTGGVCGYNSGTISGCYSTATVNSTASGGVLVGYSFRTVENSFAYGHAQGNADSFGLNGGTMKNCFYLSTTSDDGFWTGKAGATADQFKSGEVAYLLSLQDFFWKQTLQQDSYPNFTGNIVANANGNYHNHTDAATCNTCQQAANTPNKVGSNYVITNETELKWFSTEVNSGKTTINAILTTDIAVTGWTPIGTEANPFNGTLDGNGYTVTINSMANTSVDNAGLVGYLGSSGKISNIKVDGTVTGGSNVGGVVGYCLGTLQNVINVATVNGTSNVGGVAGYIGSTESSQNLGNTGTVTGGTPGGVVGAYNGTASLVNCYSSTQSLCGTYTSGGFINCYDTVGSQTDVTKVESSAFTSGEVAYRLHTRGDGQTWGQNLTNGETAPNCLNNSPQVFRGTSGDYHNHTGESCDKCSAEPPLENGVYQISTAQQLFGYAKIIESGTSGTKAVLTADIVVTDTWTPIYNNKDTIDGSYNGTFDGRGYSITFAGTVATKQIGDLSKWTAMFATTESGAVIQNLTVSGSFTATSGRVGAIVGSNSGTIKNCRVINSAVSSGGALVGYNDGTIQNCYSLVPDRPLAKSNDGKIANSYHLGTDTTDSTVATQQQFQSGEIAMKLAAGNTDTDTLKWGQTIGTDDYPILGGKTVFCVEDYYHNHTSGSCAACDGKPTQNADGAYEIENYAHLLWFAKLVNGSLLTGMAAKPNINAVLNGNIAVESSWPGIGINGSEYGGTFEGGGHTVTLTNAGENSKQMFGTTSAAAKLDAICVQDGYLTYIDSAAVTNCYRPQKAPLFNTKTAGSAANCYTLGKLAEQVGSANFTNCYQAESPASGTGITAKNEAAFTSGEVAYLLAKGDSEWGQTLSGSTYPTYPGTAVYYAANANPQYHNHNGSDCTYCNSKPEQDNNGWYIIRTAGELKWFAKWVNGDSTVTTQKHPAANARLVNDITLNTSVLNHSGELNSSNNFEPWTPIGGINSDDQFSGTFDGNGKTIRGLYINSSNSNYVGLFAVIKSGGAVKDVNIMDSYVCGNYYVGLLCGANGNNPDAGGTISGCTVSGAVKGLWYIGSICGDNVLGTLQGCISDTMVVATFYVGGICGNNRGGTVDSCRNTGSVTGTGNNVGGVCGYNDWRSKTSKISGCTNTGSVTSTDDNVGGVCGYNYANCTIQNSHSTNATVTGQANIGGVCGKSDGSITDCTASGSVISTINSGDAFVGGVCGYNSGTVQECTSGCTVTANANRCGGICGYNYNGTVQGSRNTGNVTSAGNNVGGVCGYNQNATLKESYNAGIVSGGTYVGGVCGYIYRDSARVQDCYNTGTVTGTGDVGGVCAYAGGQLVTRCYNTGGVSSNGGGYVGGICATGASKTTYCYYLEGTSNQAFGYGSGTNCESKTEAEFGSGEVAYLLQEAVNSTATDGETPAEIWGQTIGTNASPVLQWQTDYKKVYPTAEDSPCTGYSNTNNDSRDHEYKNGKCIYCGEKQPTQIAYTVTIPATVELGDDPATVTISATGVTLPDNKQLNIKVADDSEFKVTLEGDTSESPDSATYSVNDGDVEPGDTVLTAKKGETEKSASLTFKAPESTTYSGTYKGTVTFTVSVDDKTTS